VICPGGAVAAFYRRFAAGHRQGARLAGRRRSGLLHGNFLRRQHW